MKRESKPIGIRLPKEVLSKIEKLAKEEVEDRSGMIRKLVIRGYSELVREKAARKYVEGRVTLSEAARQAGFTLWEMEKYLVDKGFRSNYSPEDLQRELNLLS